MPDPESEVVPVVSVKDMGAVEREEVQVLDIKVPENSELPAIAKVYVKNPRYPEGTIIEVPGLGGVPNFGSKEITFVQAVQFEQINGKPWPVSNGKPEDLTIEVQETATSPSGKDVEEVTE